MSTYNRKRTRKPSQGLGDTIESITEATGIKAAVKFVAGEDCGCEERKEKLNALFPRHKPLCLNEDEYNWWSEFREKNAQTLNYDELDRIAAIWNRIFQRRKIYRPCTCNPKEWQKLINEINYVWETYNN